MTTQCEKAFEEYCDKKRIGRHSLSYEMCKPVWQSAWEARGTADQSKLEILKEQRMKEHPEDHGEDLSTCSRCAEICGYVNSIEAIKMVGVI